MEKFKKQIALFIAVVLVLSTPGISYAGDITSAAKLKELGLLDDISGKAMDEKLSRMVGLTMILKSLGYTSEAVSIRAADCPFNDVPEWFRGWAATAIDLGITTGASKTKFDPNDKLTQKMFYVFQLRALGYDKAATWDNTEATAITAGLIKKGVSLNAKAFTKRDASEVMLSALNSTVQSQGIKLIDKLVDDSVVDEAKAVAAGFNIEHFGLKDGKTFVLRNAFNAKTSSDGKIVVWQDSFLTSVDETDWKRYSINKLTGEKYLEGHENNYIRVINLDTGKRFVVGDPDKSNFILMLSSDGKTVVFTENDHKNPGRVCGVNLDTGRKFVILENTDKKRNWHVSPKGTVIFWHTNNNGEMINWDDDIYAKNWETGEEYVICEAEGDQWLQDMTPDGKIVIWQDYRNWDEYKELYVDIYGKNLETGEEFVIKDGPGVFEMSMLSRNRLNPRMTPDGKTVVYARDRSTLFPAEIYGINLETGEEFAICDDGNGYKDSPVISDDGQIVVWKDNRNAENARPGDFSFDNPDIYGKNLKTGEEIAIGNMVGEQTHPMISSDGRIVVWQDLNNVNNNWNIYGRNLDTGEAFTVSDDTGNQILKSMSSDGKIVVWEYNQDTYIKSIAPFAK